MSREYIDDVPGDAAASLRAIRDATTRIADTLDDYMAMSLASIEVTNAAKADLGEDYLRVLAPLVDALKAIRERRTAR